MSENILINNLIAGDREALDDVNRYLDALSAEQRVRWAVQFLPETHILTSSFGI